MSTVKKEFGPGYDYPNRMFNFWAVIVPTVLLTALAVAAVYYFENRSSTPAPQNVIVSCSRQLCPQPSGSSSPTAKKSSSAAAIGPAGITAGRTGPLAVVSSTRETSHRLAISPPGADPAPAGANPPAAESATVAAAVLASG